MKASLPAISRRSFLTVATGAVAGGAVGVTRLTPDRGLAEETARTVPVIYSTDLLHPHDDPDDHFDLGCLYAHPGVDLRAVILDNGEHQAKRPGHSAVWQLNYLTGRHVPSAIGLRHKLNTPDDPGLDQPAEHQNGVNLILQTLRDSAEKVAIMFVGSARDVVAAYNRAPELFRAKVRSIHGFIGEASDPKFVEYNAGLDPQAYVRLMRADLPFFWIPCFDGGLWQNRGHASFWQIRHGEVLEQAPAPLLRYFLYMLRKETADPIAYLSQTVTPEDRRWLMDGKRNLWAGALVGLAAGGQIRHEGKEVVGFSPVDVIVDDDGKVRVGPGPSSRRVMRFEIKDQQNFAAAVTQATAGLLTRFPVVRQPAAAGGAGDSK